jgi:NAD(P)-dependent dehydrogenase (short-subunit alcohol dehydrogenase family)
MSSTTSKNGKKTALITGANAGIGKEIARQLAVGGEFSKVYLACRNNDKAFAAKKDLEQATGTGETAFEIILMDVTKPAAVRAAVSSLDQAIDVLIMNAGTTGDKTNIKLTPEGVTEVFASNLLGHVVLLDELLKTKKLTSAAVYLASEAARGVKQLGIKSPVFESYSAEEFSSVVDGKFFAGKKADPMMAFGQVKFLGAMWMSSVARKNPELRLISVSPGNTSGTDASNHLPLPLKLLIQYIMYPVVFPLFGMVHDLETGAGRIVRSLGDTSIKSGRFYASPAGKLTGPLVDQSTIRPEMNNETYQENANRAVHRFIS